jgi:hypothetical protein
MLLYDLIGSFIIRRALCGLTAKNYNVAFIDITASMRLDGVSVESFSAVAQLRKNSEASKFPTDSDVREAIINRNQYQFLPSHRLRLIIEELEIASRDKFSASGDLRQGLSVEHIMPQQWRAEWPLPSGKVAPALGVLVTDESMAAEIANRERLIHTLANLTLLTNPGNSSAGRSNFETKKVRLRDSLLRMNIEIAKKPQWIEAEILKRGDALADLAIGLWPAPPGV